MTKTICVCDCCGMEVDPGTLHDCYRELRTWKGWKCVPRTWEICDNCLQRLQDAMEQEIKKLRIEQKMVSSAAVRMSANEARCSSRETCEAG